jgi:alanine racemase
MIGHLVAEIHADAIRGNIQAVRARLQPSTELCAVVKANAYGHGIEQVLPVLTEANVDRIAVAQMPEALELRRLGWSGPILCLGAPLAQSRWRDAHQWAAEAVIHHIHCTICSVEEAQILSTQAKRLHAGAVVEVKVDTGMGRMGVSMGELLGTIAGIEQCPGISVDGVYTHFAAADEVDLTCTSEQLAAFRGLIAALQAGGSAIRRFHAANSSALFRLPETHLDSVRPGLALYGYWNGPEADRPADLVPCMRIVSELTAVRRLPTGHPVGYGRTFSTKRDTVLGIVPLGYADGYRRQLSNTAVMSLEPSRSMPRRIVPVVGRISMDMTAVDLTEAGDVRVGDRIVVIDNDPGAPNTVEALARQIDTIPYEVTCLLGERARRRLVNTRSKERTETQLPPPQLKPMSAEFGYQQGRSGTINPAP